MKTLMITALLAFGTSVFAFNIDGTNTDSVGSEIATAQMSDDVSIKGSNTSYDLNRSAAENTDDDGAFARKGASLD